MQPTILGTSVDTHTCLRKKITLVLLLNGGPFVYYFRDSEGIKFGFGTPLIRRVRYSRRRSGVGRERTMTNNQRIGAAEPITHQPIGRVMRLPRASHRTGCVSPLSCGCMQVAARVWQMIGRAPSSCNFLSISQTRRRRFSRSAIVDCLMNSFSSSALQ